jgi:hypothetical protein
MYRGIIILVVLFILLTVLYQHKKDFRKVICYNSIITLFLLIALSIILLFRNLKLNKMNLSENFFTDEESLEEEDIDIKELFLKFDINYDDVKDFKKLEKTLLVVFNNIGIDIKSISKILFKKGSVIVTIEFNKDVKDSHYKNVEKKLKALLKDEVIPIKMKNGKTVFYKGSNVKISKDEDEFEEETVKTIQSINTSGSGSGSGIKQSHVKGVGNIFAPRIIIKKDSDNNRDETNYVNKLSKQSVPQQIKTQCNNEDAKANVMKAQHYRDYNNFDDIKLGTFKKSHNKTKCQNPDLDVRVGKNLDEKTYFPGYSYMPPSNWRVPEKRPPVCIAQKKCLDHPVSVFDKGTPSDALEYYGVGSILPKFTYREETDFVTCPKQQQKNSKNNNSKKDDEQS